MNAAVAAYIYTLVPEFLMRFICWLLIHTVYRLEKRGLDHIPEEGAAVVVCNHVSFVDALVILAASPRPIRFVMDHRIFKTPFFGWIFRTAKAIPIAPAKEDPWLMEKAFVDIAQALHEGELVCIFPEGKLTSDGEINEFKGGIKKIVERSQKRRPAAFAWRSTLRSRWPMQPLRLIRCPRFEPRMSPINRG